MTISFYMDVRRSTQTASLERQLAAAEFFSQQEIVERALTAWLRENGHPM